jgi:AcrR family transcriptional regulator
MTYDEKLEHVLRRATAVFAEKGYHRASIRDIARATGMSLAGLRCQPSRRRPAWRLAEAGR